ncbi:hypothetical protein [Alloactinosynnema sp. L-07]|uniref:hypothetical protein n=1 Tax=Alloactinosynnema sp. L-07 TaxID=1653480 RepID=UPI00065EF9FC|nr:hypothetical protein [Alloactinosynnema sp. L-07]CRK57222.1 hypothetical protein [Alloactinosynnema sp. L-07]
MTRLRLGVVFVVLAAVFAGWGGWTLWQAGRPFDAEVARDAALQAGRSGVATLTTLDYQSIDAGFGRWLEVSAGPLREELSSAQDASKQQIAKAKTVTTGTVLEAAVTELDVTVGTARVIAAVEIVVRPEVGEQAAKRSRFQADLARTDTGWKLTGLAQVPYVPA